MKYCAKCKTTVTGNGTRCPLCQGMLQETGTEDTRGDVFPRIPDTSVSYTHLPCGGCLVDGARPGRVPAKEADPDLSCNI